MALDAITVSTRGGAHVGMVVPKAFITHFRPSNPLNPKPHVIYEPAAFRVYLALGFSYCFKRANINIVIQKYIFTPTYGTQISCPAVLGLAARHYELRISGYSYFHLFLFAVCVCVFFFQPA